MGLSKDIPRRSSKPSVYDSHNCYVFSWIFPSPPQTEGFQAAHEQRLHSHCTYSRRTYQRRIKVGSIAPAPLIGSIKSALHNVVCITMVHSLFQQLWHWPWHWKMHSTARIASYAQIHVATQQSNMYIIAYFQLDWGIVHLIWANMEWLKICDLFWFYDGASTMEL